jgi:hypothetical protein
LESIAMQQPATTTKAPAKAWTSPRLERIGTIADVALVNPGPRQCNPGGQQCNQS